MPAFPGALPNEKGTVHKRHKKDSRGTKRMGLILFCALCVLFLCFLWPVPDPVQAEEGGAKRRDGADQTDVPLTVCPLSNVRLRVFDSMKSHNLPQLLNAGLCVTINSDDPAYFGGYINENFHAIWDSFDLTQDDVATLARNSIEAAVLNEARRQQIMREIDDLTAS
jgi:hypothetical protein